MKYPLIFRLLFAALVISLINLEYGGFHAQGDTTWVSTYTWEAQNNPETNYDSPGRRWFQFPESDSDVEYRKVLMYHKLKCFDQGTAGGLGYACGEWDYLTYSYLFDHTGELDSTVYTHPYYKINNQEFETDTLIFSPVNGAPHDTYNTEYSRINLDIVGEVTTTINSETEQVPDLTSATNARRLTFTITAQELSTMGVVPGLPIKRIGWNVESFQSDLLTLKVSQGEGEWQQVYAYPVEITDFLELDLEGDEMVWDSESDLHFDLLLDGVVGVSSDAVSSPSFVEAFDTDGGYVTFDGLDKISIDPDLFTDLNNEVTIECLLKGDADYLPANTTIFEAVNFSGQREINVHMPWSNSRIYWDAGYDGGYDRIDQAALENDYEGVWVHWAFVKNASTGVMKMVRNGVVWHEGMDKDNSFGNIAKMFLGSGNNDVYSYRGDVENFRVWSTALDESTISEWMFKSDTEGHPSSEDLIVDFDFNGENGTSENVNGDYFGNAGRYDFTASELFLDGYVPGGEDLAYRPAFELTQGPEESFVAVAEYLTVETIQLIPPVSLSSWEVQGNGVVLQNVEYGWPANQLEVVYNQLGDTISYSTISGEILAIENNQLEYFGEPFEVVDRYELGRYITPYGINLSLGDDGWTWVYDVTDYLPLLRDSVELECGNWQELLDLKFAFIEGTPPRDVKRVEAFWNGTYYLNTWDDQVMSHEYSPEPGEEMFRLVTRASGHGFGTGNNCGEFCYNIHSVLVDSTAIWSWEIMQECADNPLYPQGGTWIYDRAAWCPGAPVATQRFELTPYVSADETFDVEYDITHDPYGNYRMEGQIISYSSPNMSHDVELMDILAPNNRKTLSRWNPVCEDPIVEIRNNGYEPLVSCTFTYGVSGEDPSTYVFTPNTPMEFLETRSVSLPYDAPVYTVGDDEDLLQFDVSVELSNGLDEEVTNGSAHSAFRRPPTWAYNDLDDNRIIVWVKTNNVPSETSIVLNNSEGAVAWTRSYSEANTIHRDTIELNEGCYRFTVNDSGDDGLSFWANNDGGGYARFKKVAGGNFTMLEDDFGKSISYAFRFETNLFTEHEEILVHDETTSLDVFPNPTNGIVRAKLTGFNSNVHWSLNNTLGQTVLSGEFNPKANKLLLIDMCGLSDGMYSLFVSGEDGQMTSWVVKN